MKAIPIPRRWVRRVGVTADLRRLKVKQSKFLRKPYAQAWTLASRALGKGNFAVRTVKDGARVWRTR